MTPRILFVGGERGSWAVRGRQMAAALGARATQEPQASDWSWAEVIVLVKRAIDRWGAAAAATGRPIVWDVLDVWQQPEDNARPIAEIAAQVAGLADQHRVARLIGATSVMADAIGGTYLAHHARPLLRAREPAPHVGLVVYEGTPKYLGAWRPALEQACARRGWRFAVNESVAMADIVIALRDGRWDGEICRQWKSGVKYVNALAAGRPVVTHSCAGFDDVRPIGTTVARLNDLEAALDRVADRTVRDQAFALSQRRGHEFALRTTAERYRALIQQVAQVAA